MSVKCRCALDHPQCRKEFVSKTEGKEVFVMMRWRQAESWKFIRLLRLFLFLSKELRKIMNYGTIKTMDTANGEGLRVSLFVSGCHHACPGCFNPEAWNFAFGKPFTQETIDEIIQELSADYISGLSLLGGEPLAPENQEQVWNLVRQVREQLPHKTIWCYSGFTYEFITEVMFPNLPFTYQILSHLDVLIEGRFVQQLVDLTIKFRGSRNQRVLDVPLSLEKGMPIWSTAVDDQKAYEYYPSPEKELFTARIENFLHKVTVE